MSLIEVKGLKKSFGSLEVLKGIDLTVEQGERIAIIGGSGCGKSVFLRSLCLLEKPDAGQIVIDGREITAKGAKIDEIRRSMGMVFQKFHLFSEMDVMDNLCLAPTRILKMPRAEAEKKAMELLSQVGLAARAHACYENIHFPVCVSPDFRTCGGLVNGRIRGIDELARDKGVRNLLRELIGFGYGPFHSLGALCENEFRTVCLHELPALNAHRLRHHYDDPVASGGRNGCQADARVAGSRLDYH